MNKRQEEKALAAVSKRARKLFFRIRNDSRFYKAWGEDIPKAMKELEDAGLVGVAGRVVSITACYVPTRGFQQCRLEQWPGQQ